MRARQDIYLRTVAGKENKLVSVASKTLADPARGLVALCERLGIAWDPAMLHWQPGIHPEDGIWASHWYDQVAASTGFGPPAGPLPELDGDAARLADECRPYYAAMRAYSI